MGIYNIKVKSTTALSGCLRMQEEDNDLWTVSGWHTNNEEVEAALTLSHRSALERSARASLHCHHHVKQQVYDDTDSHLMFSHIDFDGENPSA